MPTSPSTATRPIPPVGTSRHHQFLLWLVALLLASAGCAPEAQPLPSSATTTAGSVQSVEEDGADAFSADTALLPAAQQVAHGVRYDDAPTPSLAADAATTHIPPEVVQRLQAARIGLDEVSLLVTPVQGGTPLVNHRSRVPMNPASVMKMVTTAAALDVLGPAYVWRTPVWADGSIRDGVLHGNLYILGTGDPKLVLERLWLLMRDLRQRGLHTITGDLVLDNSAFDIPARDPGAFDGEPLRAYNATPDALLVNFKAISLGFAPDPVQPIAHVSMDPPLAGVTVPTHIALNDKTCSSKWHGHLRASFHDARQISLGGSYPASCGSKRWTLAYSAPEQYAARAIAGMWLHVGGTINGQVRYGRVPASLSSQPPLAQTTSPTLTEIIRDINKYSNNVMTQQVLLSIGLHTSGTGSYESARQAVSDWWRSRLGQTPQPVLDNGSGLSRTARISTSSLAAMLQAMWYTPTMPEYMASLPIVGVDGTLHNSRLRARGAAHLKTGTLRDASALAGYIQADNGQTYVLAAIANSPQAAGARRAFEALVDWVVHTAGGVP